MEIGWQGVCKGKKFGNCWSSGSQVVPHGQTDAWTDMTKQSLLQ